MSNRFTVSLKRVALILCALAMWSASALAAEAATLSLSPSTGVYQSGSTFTVRVVVNTNGQPINAADGTLSFNPRELSVVSVTRSSSIFNLWVTEPTFSNSGGTINFSGGLPSGYTGSAGTIMSVTFRSAGAGTARVSFTSGSVLANDGRGTNILTSMNSGTYTIQAASASPEPEVIEYVAPANTPAAPTITSSTHSDSAGWYKEKEATLAWTLPAGITGVRTLLDTNPTSVPTKVYDDPIRSITLSDLPEGESYFHVQFRNADGWGRVAHYRLAVDAVAPEDLVITQALNTDSASPEQTLAISVVEETSGIAKYLVKVDAAEPFEFVPETATSTLTLPALEPGYHTVILEAVDKAGNSTIGTFSFSIAAFDKPTFTEYPSEINEEVIPVIKGMTRPGASVEVTMIKVGSDPTLYTVSSDENGEFIFIPEGRLSTGVYELTARATDAYGAQSEYSETIRIAVQQAGYVRVGMFLINILSIIIPLIALSVLSIISVLYGRQYLTRFRRRVTVESGEALDIMYREFSRLEQIVRAHETDLRESRKANKLTKAEEDMVNAVIAALTESKRAVEKEIIDVKNLTK